MSALITGRIDLQASKSFAALSGDFNPQHLDPVKARRLLFGGTVIHGIHLLLLGLDAALGARAGGCALASLKAVFSAPVPTGSSVRIEIERAARDAETILLTIGSRPAATIDVGWTGAADSGRPHINDLTFAFEAPVERTIGEAAGMQGSVPLAVGSGSLLTLFPNLAARLPPDQVSVLLAATRIVGMECPGLHSIFAALALNFTASNADLAPQLYFEVTRTRPALRLCSMKVRGPGVEGTIEALFRPDVVDQPGISEIKAVVPPASFAGQRILIAGGSRGLGEVSAKVAASGGAEVIIGYAQGRDDALRVAGEITQVGGSASVMHLDVTADMATALSALPEPVTHLYYFASPRIRPNNSGEFDGALVDHYSAYYVSGLNRLLSCLLDRRPDGITLLNPSTIYLDEPDQGFAEYAAAKASSEAFCHEYVDSLGARLRVVVPRLPRLKTDQTNSLQDDKLPSALDVLLRVLPRNND
jgi:NAD(P)-dependent dehydrogenase (short-subunit alcohol dehydrogenase family)